MYTYYDAGFSWSNGQFESRQKSGVASDLYRRHSFQGKFTIDINFILKILVTINCLI